MLFIIFFILPIIYISFHFATKIAYFSSLFFSVAGIILSFFLDIDFISILIAVFIFNTVPLVCRYFKNLEESQFKKIDRNITLVEQTVDKLESSMQKLVKVNSSLSKNVSEISKLYEITRQTSKALEFEEVFKIFTDIIKQNFTFKSCKFIVLKDEQIPDKGYYLEKEKVSISKMPLVEVTEKDEKIIRIVKNLKTSFFVSENRKEPISVKLELDSEEESLTAIPLISEKEIIAVLIIFNLPYKEYYNMLIFSGQFSLQLKKINLYEKIQQLSILDDLTGVFVRRYFLQRFKEEFKRAVKHNLYLALLMLDIDHFKQHNDNYGHLVGDRLLKDIADIIKSTIREIDLVGRYGGEEFTLVLPDTDLSGAELVAERIRTGIHDHKFKVYDETISITASLGICLYPDNTHFFDDLVHYADMALYRAKHEGRNRCRTFDALKDKVQYHKA